MFKYFVLSVAMVAVIIVTMCIPSFLGQQNPVLMGTTHGIISSQPVVLIPENASCVQYTSETKRISKEWEVLGHNPSITPKFVTGNTTCEGR